MKRTYGSRRPDNSTSSNTLVHEINDKNLAIHLMKALNPAYSSSTSSRSSVHSKAKTSSGILLSNSLFPQIDSDSNQLEEIDELNADSKVTKGMHELVEGGAANRLLEDINYAMDGVEAVLTREAPLLYSRLYDAARLFLPKEQSAKASHKNIADYKTTGVNQASSMGACLTSQTRSKSDIGGEIEAKSPKNVHLRSSRAIQRLGLLCFTEGKYSEDPVLLSLLIHVLNYHCHHTRHIDFYLEPERAIKIAEWLLADDFVEEQKNIYGTITDVKVLPIVSKIEAHLSSVCDHHHPKTLALWLISRIFDAETMSSSISVEPSECLLNLIAKFDSNPKNDYLRDQNYISVLHHLAARNFLQPSQIMLRKIFEFDIYKVPDAVICFMIHVTGSDDGAIMLNSDPAQVASLVDFIVKIHCPSNIENNEAQINYQSIKLIDSPKETRKSSAKSLSQTTSHGYEDDLLGLRAEEINQPKSTHYSTKTKSLACTLAMNVCYRSEDCRRSFEGLIPVLLQFIELSPMHAALLGTIIYDNQLLLEIIKNDSHRKNISDALSSIESCLTDEIAKGRLLPIIHAYSDPLPS